MKQISDDKEVWADLAKKMREPSEVIEIKPLQKSQLPKWHEKIILESPSIGNDDSLGFGGSYMQHEPTLQSVTYANGMTYWTAIGQICNVVYKPYQSLKTPPVITHLGNWRYRMVFCPIDLDGTILSEWSENVDWGIKENISIIRYRYEYDIRYPEPMCGSMPLNGPIAEAFGSFLNNCYPRHIRQMFIQTAKYHDKVVSERKIDRALYTRPDPEQCTGGGHATFYHPEADTTQFYKKDPFSIPEDCLGRPLFRGQYFPCFKKVLTYGRWQHYSGRERE